MAYINQEKKAELAPAIKAVFKKYGMKGSISIRNHMVLVVTIKSGPLDIIGNYVETGIKKISSKMVLSEGSTISLKGTIKGHNVRESNNQTILTRCKAV